MDAIRRALVGDSRPGYPAEIRYRVPWDADRVTEAGSVALIVSQAVLDRAGFRLAARTTYPGDGVFPRRLLARRFEGHTDEDFVTCGVSLTAVRPL